MSWWVGNFILLCILLCMNYFIMYGLMNVHIHYEYAYGNALVHVHVCLNACTYKNTGHSTKGLTKNVVVSNSPSSS